MSHKLSRPWSFSLVNWEALTHTGEQSSGFVYSMSPTRACAVCLIGTTHSSTILESPPLLGFTSYPLWTPKSVRGFTCPHRQPLSMTFECDHSGVWIPPWVLSSCRPHGSPASLFPPPTSSHFFWGDKNPSIQQHPLGSFLGPDLGDLVQTAG